MKNFLLLILLFFSLKVNATVYLKLSPLFSENCVLQRGKAVKIFGVDQVNSLVKVELVGKKFTCVTDKNGKWIATISLPKHLSGGPFKLKVSNQRESLENNKVYIGDVWLASGQSNMERNVDAVDNAEFNIKDADNYKGKVFLMRILGNAEAEMKDFKLALGGAWEESNSQNIGIHSAVANSFAKEIYKNQKVPIGIIEAIWGSTPIQSWMSKEALEKSYYSDHHKYLQELWCQSNFNLASTKQNPQTLVTLCLGQESHPQFTTWLNNHKLVNTAGLNCHRFALFNILGKSTIKIRERSENPNAKFIENFIKELEQSYISSGESKLFITDWSCGTSLDPKTESSVFNGMINPITPYTIKGVLWYQGENNLTDYKSYTSWFKNMVADWRQRWNDNLTFITVQLSSYKAQEGSDYLSRFREIQEKIPMIVPNTYIVSSIDLGTRNGDIHTMKKDEVGHRLALVALCKVYNHKNIKYKSPSPRKITPTPNALKIDFGLEKLFCKGTCPKVNQLSQDFLVAGEDKIYHPAQVKIYDRSIIASSPKVKNPKYIRYAWSEMPHEFIYNQANLPIMPFRNDNW